MKSPGSFEWLRDQVSAAVQAQAKESNPLSKDSIADVYVSETYTDFVIVRDYGQNKWWKVPYTIDDKNVVTLGEATEVAQTWTDISKSIRMLVPVQKADLPKHMRQISYGVVFEPTTEDVKKADLQGDCMKAEEIELAAHAFMERYQAVGDMHTSAVPLAKVVESYLAPCDFSVETASGAETILKGSWVLAVKWPDTEWAKIEKGDYTGYSAGGFGFRTPVTDEAGGQVAAVSKAADGTSSATPLNWLWGMDIQEVSGVTKGANDKKFFILKAAKTKTEGGQEYAASDYAYAPDPAQPSGWKIRLAEYVDGSKQVTAAQVGRAAAALSPGGFRGKQVDIPEADLAGVKSKVRAAWKKCNPEADPKDMPESIAKADEPSLFGWVRDAFRKVAGASGPTDGGIEMTPEEIQKAVTDSLAEGLAPFDARIKKLEETMEAAGAEGEGATTVAKTNDGTAAEPTPEQVMKTTIADGIKEGLKPLEDRIAKLEQVAGQRQSGLEEGGAHPVKKTADGAFSWEGSGLLL